MGIWTENNFSVAKAPEWLEAQLGHWILLDYLADNMYFSSLD